MFHRRRIDKTKDTKTVLAGQAAQKVQYQCNPQRAASGRENGSRMGGIGRDAGLSLPARSQVKKRKNFSGSATFPGDEKYSL